MAASCWNRQRVFGVQDSCIFKRPDFYQALTQCTAEPILLCSAWVLKTGEDHEQQQKNKHFRANVTFKPSIATNPVRYKFMIYF